MKTPLGPLPALSRTARRALLLAALLALGTALALVAQAWALATALGPLVSAGTPAAAGNWALLAAAVAARALLGWATETASARAAAGAKEEIRAQLLDASLRRGPEWVQGRGPAELTALATRGLDALDAYFTRYLPALVTAAIVPPVVGAWILLHDGISAGLVALTVPLVPLFGWLVGRFTAGRTDRAARAVRRMSGQLLELVRALPVLTAFGRAGAQGEVVGRVGEAHRRSSNSALRVAFLSALVLELLSSLSVALVAVGIGLRLASGELDLTTGLLVLVLAPECYLPLRAVGAAHHASEDGVEALRRVEEVLDGEQRQPRRGEVPEPGGRLAVRDLRVARRDRHAPDGLSFTACPGEIVHLSGYDGIGPSGSGKSTTFAVLLGFARPERGRACYGGRDLTELDEDSWRRLVAWVPQRPVFSGATVADELEVAVCDQPAGTSEDLTGPLAEVAAEHLLHRRVDELSTGERQRVAVARALLRLRGDASVLLLDEPTAHLDGATAEQVNAAIRQAAVDGAAVVLASHRPDAEPADAEPAQLTEQAPAAAGSGPRGRVRDLLTGRTWFGIALGALSLLSGVALTATSAWLISRASQQPPILTLTVAVVGVRAFALSRAALRYAERLVTHDAAFRLAGRLRRRLWDALVQLGPARTAALRRGEGLARLVDDADAVRDLVPRTLLPPLVGGVVALGAVAVETAVLPAAGALLAAALLVAGTAGPAAALAAERRASAAAAEGRRQLAGRVLALLDGSAELIAFGAHARRRAELRDADAEVSARGRRAAFGAGAATAVVTSAVGAAVLGGAVLGARAVVAGQLAPELAPLLALVPLAAGEAVAALPQAAQSWRPLRDAQARTAELLAAPEQQPAVVDSDDIVLDGVDARWPGAVEPALRDVSVKIPEGAHVAIVGPSGGGKSTLLAALLGFLTAERGEVRAPTAAAWCPQDPQLVSTSVRENLRIAAPRADDEQLADGLRLAGLPEVDLDALVGSGGAQLSGGEAQRVALARALLREDARALLLDEPTAHLDAATSEPLLAQLHQRWRGTTVVHVTHRWSETEHADVVLRAERGTVSVVRETTAGGQL